MNRGTVREDDRDDEEVPTSAASTVVNKELEALTTKINMVSLRLCLMDLPVTLLQEIFFKLPIISIMQLKLVCWYLYKLVSHPHFTSSYSKKYPFTAMFGAKYEYKPRSSSNLSLMHCNTDLNLLETSDNNLGDDQFCSNFKPKIPSWRDEDSYWLLEGTRNGLLCLSEYTMHTQKVYICNPVTDECIVIKEWEAKQYGILYIGFGFCRSTNNYKVLRLVADGPYYEYQEVKILTVGVDDTWRASDPVSSSTIPSLDESNNCLILNEVFHWVVPSDNEHGKSITTFDFEEEKWVLDLSLPSGLVPDFLCVNLASTNNLLCLVERTNSSEIVIWKMKEYGVAESWTKDMVLVLIVASAIRCGVSSHVRILGNGDMLFSDPIKNFSFSYNPTKREATEIKGTYSNGMDYSPNFSSLKEIMNGACSSTMRVISK